MKRLIPLAVAAAILSSAQSPSNDPRKRRMGDGRTQFEHILEDEYEQSLEDADEIVKLGAELKEELEKNDYRVLSVDAYRKAERIEKLAKSVKQRLKRH
jgi:hypothetical protein